MENEELNSHLQGATEHAAGSRGTDFLRLFEQLLETQSWMVAAQASALSMQNLAPLPLFNGEWV